MRAVSTYRLVLQLEIKPNMNDPSNDFVEFVQVWGGRLHMYLEAVIMYESRNGSKYMRRHISNDFAIDFNKRNAVLKNCRVYGSSRTQDKRKKGK